MRKNNLVKVCQSVLQVQLACTTSISLEPSPDAKTTCSIPVIKAWEDI